MAIPQIISAQVISSGVIRLEFSSALDTGMVTAPLTSFAINEGDIALGSYTYSGNIYVDLNVTPAITSDQEITVTYTPDADILLCLRGPVSDENNVALVRAVAVRSFQIKVLNNPDRGDNLAQDYPSTGDAFDSVVDDFILAFGRQEAIQVSNIDNPSAQNVNRARIKMAIEDALSLIDSYVKMAPKAGKLLISANRRRTSLIFARYYLDSVRRRENVTQDYERAIKELDAQLENNLGLVPEDDLAVNNGGIMRVFRIPQRYNSTSGKGLSGWWTDSASMYDEDWRENDINSEQNNDEGNYSQNASRGYNITPNDGGGTDNNP